MLNVTENDSRISAKETFIIFRKTLKQMARDEYAKLYGEQCEQNNTKKILKIIKKNVLFDGNISKQHKISNNAEFAKLLAETSFIIFSILCSMQSEFRVWKHIRNITGVISDVSPGTSAVGRIVHVINIIGNITSNHEIFEIITPAVTMLGNFIEKTFHCEYREEDSDCE